MTGDGLKGPPSDGGSFFGNGPTPWFVVLGVNDEGGEDRLCRTEQRHPGSL